MKKLWRGLVRYLSDWKNILIHSLIGVGIIVVALFLPVRPIFRIGLLFLVVITNILRMRWEKNTKKEREEKYNNKTIKRVYY